MSVDNIAAGIVTYNRKHDLSRCIDALLQQCAALQALYIIDNASSDGTFEYLLEKGYISGSTSKNRISTTREGKELIYIRLPNNLGGAGGFFTAQKMIVDDGYDWMWLMDDDGRPSEGCLDVLISALSHHDVLIVNPIVLNMADPTEFAFGLSKRITTPEKAQNVAEDGVVFNYGNPFNGTLISKHVVEKIGFIKKEMFIWGDEVEYFERIKKHHIRFATVIDAHFYHPKNKSITERMFGKVRIVRKPVHLEMNYFRNKAYINRVYKRSLGALFLLKYTVYFTKNGDYQRLLNFWRYYIDGWFKRFRLANIL